MITTYKKTAKTIGILLIGLLLGWVIFGDNNSEKDSHDHKTEQIENTIWTCSMHPQVRQNEKGLCPLCAMDLTPLNENSDNDSPIRLEMTADAVRLSSIETSIVGENMANNISNSDDLQKEIMLTGKVKMDERESSTQAAHIGGRIEKLYVKSVGEKINKGQKIATVYSPDLVAAQKELFEAKKMQQTPIKIRLRML